MDVSCLRLLEGIFYQRKHSGRRSVKNGRSIWVSRHEVMNLWTNMTENGIRLAT